MSQICRWVLILSIYLLQVRTVPILTHSSPRWYGNEGDSLRHKHGKKDKQSPGSHSWQLRRIGSTWLAICFLVAAIEYTNLRKGEGENVWAKRQTQ
jgi:hypothetical protein